MTNTVIAFVSSIFNNCLNLFRKGEKVHKQKMGNISDSNVISINGDVCIPKGQQKKKKEGLPIR